MYSFPGEKIPGMPTGLRETVTNRADGVFMWARLTIRRILHLRRQGITWQKKSKGKSMPSPSELEDLYWTIIDDMDEKSASFKLIQCICFALRPLSLSGNAMGHGD